MTERFKKIKELFLTKPFISGAVGVVFLGIIFSTFSDGDNGEEIITVKRGEFIQEVSVSGKVIAAENVDLGFAQSGRISRVYAKVGDSIVRGSLIAEIENGDLQASLESQKAKLESLKAGTRVEDIKISEVAVQNAETSVVNAVKNGYVNADDAIRNKVDQFMSNPKSANPQLNFLVSDSQLKNDIEFGRVNIEQIFSSWNMRNLDLSKIENIPLHTTLAKSDLKTIGTYLDRVALAVNSMSVSSTISQTTIDGYKAAISTARSNITSALSTLSSSDEELKNAQSQLSLKKAGSTQSDIDAQSAQVRLAEAELSKTRVYAPFSGIITKMDAKVGKIISPNTPEISMISRGNFQIESFVPEINIALLKNGDKAIVTLDAYGENVLFPASIISIDPAETIQDGVSTYKAVLQFVNQDSRIKSGMTANVAITTESRLGVLTVPVGILINKDGKKFVTVKEDGSNVEREVVTGSVSSLGNVEIISGIEEGNIVVVKASE